MRNRNTDALDELLSEVTNHKWNSCERLGWLTTFLVLLARLAPRARQKNDDGDNALSRIAWTFGQTVDDPVYTHQACIEGEHDEHEAQQYADDMESINGFAKRSLECFGIEMTRLWEALTYCQSDDNLFSEDHEDRWFSWARSYFLPAPLSPELVDLVLTEDITAS